MTLESLLRKIDILLRSLLRGVGEFGCLGGALVHGGGQCDERVVRFGQDAAAFVNVVAVEAHHERLVGGGAELGERAHDALGDGVARGDATEHVSYTHLTLPTIY